MATSTTGQLPSRLFYINDSTTWHCFLVDTGTEVSVVLPSKTERKRQPDLSLQATNSTPIAT